MGLQIFFWEIFRQIIERGIKEDQLYNVYKNGYIQTQSSCKVFVLKVSIDVWSKSSDENLQTTFVVCVYATKYVVPSMLIIPEKQLNMDVIKGCDIEGAHVTTATKCFIDYTLFLNWIVLFDNSVPDSVDHPLVLVYDCFFVHYNDDIKKQLSLNSYWFYCQIIPPILLRN